MGKETHIKSSDPLESKPLEEINPNEEPLKALDERGMLEPLNEARDEADDQQQGDESGSTGGAADGEQEIRLDNSDGQVDSDAGDEETEIELTLPDQTSEDQFELEDLSEQDSGQDDDSATVETEDLKAADEEPKIELTLPDEQSEDQFKLDDLAEQDSGQNDDSTEVEPIDLEPGNEDTSDEISDGDDKPEEIKNTAHKVVTSQSTPKIQKAKKTAEAFSAPKKVAVAALVVVIISGLTIYSKPALIGLERKGKSVPPVANESKQPVKPEQAKVQKSTAPGKHDLYLAKLEEADRFREKLLEKKEEIYKLKLYYRNGIAELMDQVGREIQEAGISSYAQALENKHIELNLRTIQRRQVYIKELEKPNRWVHSGSEELLFLKRKAQLDLQMVDIAGGIDLNRHMRYINAAIQKYQPSAEKLAVDPTPADLRPLETIWNEINNQQMNKVTTALGHKDGQIIEEICSGNFKRITELSVITTMAARCLSKNNGSDLFLNGLTRLSPDEAKYLFQWQGSWICLNNVKKLAPAAAKYLFEWEGNWISLNGLTEFPPELALYLMEWKGSQLELMGLNYDKKEPDPRALKYLALWETMGGKLFVSEGIRKEMKRVM
jgi:hypothetical protein